MTKRLQVYAFFSLYLLVIFVRCAYSRSFTIDYENNQFLKDGQPFRYVSGAIHYFRVPEEYWEHRLKALRAAGLNAVETYIEWSSHEPQPGVYNFTGQNDVLKFIKLAQEADLLVILRPGPYICAERDNGGLPYWLKTLHPSMVIRTKDSNYMKYVNRWFAILLPKIKPLLYLNGGPIIMVQVENEYGSYTACDFEYMAMLRDLILKFLNNNSSASYLQNELVDMKSQHWNQDDSVVLFTIDGADHQYLKCGKVSGVYATVDFKAEVDEKYAFQVQRTHEWKGPLVNSEFYTGWLDNWGYPHTTVSSKQFTESLDRILAMGASVNLYMFHGGTTFDLSAGANYGPNYQPQPTTYDYDAPLTEAGNYTEKYLAIRDVVIKYLPDPKLPLPPLMSVMVPNKVALKKLPLNLMQLFDKYNHKTLKSSMSPLTFEELSVAYGFVVYKTKITFLPTSPSQLSILDLRDRAYIYVDNVYQGILSRMDNVFSLSINAKNNSMLTIFVENLGRVNYGKLTGEVKGIIGNVTLENRILSNWNQTGSDDLSELLNSIYREVNIAKSIINSGDYSNKKRLPSVYYGHFIVDKTDDTYLEMSQWSHGFVAINNRIIGRHWSTIGPQRTLYLPGPFLKTGNNSIIIVELEEAACRNDTNCYLSFTDTPILNAITPYN